MALWAAADPAVTRAAKAVGWRGANMEETGAALLGSEVSVGVKAPEGLATVEEGEMAPADAALVVAFEVGTSLTPALGA
jgi:hypothetical protein